MLYKKLLRDFWRHKGAYIASMALVFLGILIYNMLSLMHDSFDQSLDVYYRDYQVSDAVLKVKGMPKSDLDKLARITNIKGLEGRLEQRIRLSDESREVIFHFMSYEGDADHPINDIQLMAGRMPLATQNEIIMGNNYFYAMSLELGDQVAIIVNGKKKELTIVGVGRSPEFIYAKKNDSELISNPKTFDLVFMPYDAMSELLGLPHQVNNVAMTLYDPGAFDQTKILVEEALEGYGITEFLALEDSISDVTTRQKLNGMGSMTTALPMMFLLISGVIIYIVLKRIIEQERVQIGVLKAFGISDQRILIHYITYALIVASVGGLAGTYLGIRSIPSLIQQLSLGFNMPFLTSGLFQKYLINSVILCLVFALTSGYMGARACLKLEPADAMRPPVGKESHSGIMDKFQVVLEEVNMKLRLALRNIFRNKGRSLFILFGIAITAALLVFPLSMNQMYSKMLFDQYEKVEVYDMKITFNTYMDRHTVERLVNNFPGISLVEPQVLIPVDLYNGWRKEESAIIGLPLEGQLYNLYDMDDQKIRLSSDGLTLSHWIAHQLRVEPGDTVIVKSPIFRGDRQVAVRVSQVVQQYVGTNAYMAIDATESLLEGQSWVSALHINGSPKALKALKNSLNDSKYIATFDYSEELAAVFREFMYQTTSIVYILALVGMGIGYSVIYVAMIISLSERNRELATMLVVGFTEGEVHQVLLIEQFLISIIGIVLGIPMGKAMLASFAETSSTEFLIMPSTIPTSALVFSVVTTIIAISIPQIIARRKIGKIVVTEALNARE
jgi:putative ABC transport system permease protein